MKVFSYCLETAGLLYGFEEMLVEGVVDLVEISAAQGNPALWLGPLKNKFSSITYLTIWSIFDKRMRLWAW